jgi:hypothetical protein
VMRDGVRVLRRMKKTKSARSTARWKIVLDDGRVPPGWVTLMGLVTCERERVRGGFI